MNRRALSVLALGLLAGCAASGPLPTLEGPPPAGSAKLTVQRSSDLLISGMAARVSVNGQVVGNLYRGAAFSMPVPAGRVVLYVDQPGPVPPGQPGAGRGSRRVLTVEEGREVRFEIVPTTRLAVAGVGIPGTDLQARENSDNGWFGWRAQ